MLHFFIHEDWDQCGDILAGKKEERCRRWRGKGSIWIQELNLMRAMNSFGSHRSYRPYELPPLLERRQYVKTIQWRLQDLLCSILFLPLFVGTWTFILFFTSYRIWFASIRSVKCIWKSDLGWNEDTMFWVVGKWGLSRVPTHPKLKSTLAQRLMWRPNLTNRRKNAQVKVPRAANRECEIHKCNLHREEG